MVNEKYNLDFSKGQNLLGWFDHFEKSSIIIMEFIGSAQVVNKTLLFIG